MKKLILIVVILLAAMPCFAGPEINSGGGSITNDDLDTIAAGGTANCIWGEKSDSSGIECKTTLAISSAKLSGDLTGLAPSQLVHVACNVDDAGSSSATFHCATLAGVTNQLVGMTVYNTTDGSSGTITANDDHTITATLAGGTANHWDSGDAMLVGPGPAQSGTMFYLDASHAQTLMHPTTAGYTACYMAEGTVALKVDFGAAMAFTGTISGVETVTAGNYIAASASTTDDFMCIHNKSATVAKGLGVRGTWTHE